MFSFGPFFFLQREKFFGEDWRCPPLIGKHGSEPVGLHRSTPHVGLHCRNRETVRGRTRNGAGVQRDHQVPQDAGATNCGASHDLRLGPTERRISGEARTKGLREVASRQTRRRQLASPASCTAKFFHPQPKSLGLPSASGPRWLGRTRGATGYGWVGGTQTADDRDGRHRKVCLAPRPTSGIRNRIRG